jgi:hypothetical protein
VGSGTRPTQKQFKKKKKKNYIREPSVLARGCTDAEKGAKFENKTTTLELVGVILQFLLIPEKLVGKHIVMKVDNTAFRLGEQIGGW